MPNRTVPSVVIETDGELLRVSKIKNRGTVPSMQDRKGDILKKNVGDMIQREELNLIACEYTVVLVAKSKLRRNV